MLLDFRTRFLGSLVKWASSCVRQGQGEKEGWEEDQREGRCGHHMAKGKGDLSAWTRGSLMATKGVDSNESSPEHGMKTVCFTIQGPKAQTLRIFGAATHRAANENF